VDCTEAFRSELHDRHLPANDTELKSMGRLCLEQKQARSE
jgi:NAD(P)-dependent dehydrogenase (short-subunit alcohol dehydrogenase family)